MLNGRGKPPERTTSRWDVGVGVRGCDLPPGPGRCYLSGEYMQAIMAGNDMDQTMWK